ncbi:hypothetical protein [Streptomyces sp. GC420]|uniref:hypothetical protein n=1 Tax=Streptomyces sp. GC420 TaxID=2697568 RepID=UPI001AA11728|nr:hypothetical protein [Streptomyces sp. GC420]NBM21193.1 hypothetical protein [Streptomyces sp. GC420]
MTPLAFATSAHSASYEEDWGTLTASEGCGDIVRLGNDDSDGGLGCFERYGDVFRVWAGDHADGSPRVYWINELKNSSGVWTTYREGVCYGEWYRDSWVYCNKDFYENSTSPNKLGGQGSRIKFAYYDSAGMTSYATVVNDQ